MARLGISETKSSIEAIQPQSCQSYVICCFVQQNRMFSRNEHLKILNIMTLYEYQKLTESFCKLKSTCGLNNELDIHGMYWDERVVCKVLMYDRTNGLLHVENPNGLKWLSDLKAMEFCLENGDKIPNNR